MEESTVTAHGKGGAIGGEKKENRESATGSREKISGEGRKRMAQT